MVIEPPVSTTVPPEDAHAPTADPGPCTINPSTVADPPLMAAIPVPNGLLDAVRFTVMPDPSCCPVTVVLSTMIAVVAELPTCSTDRLSRNTSPPLCIYTAEDSPVPDVMMVVPLRASMTEPA